MPKLALPRFARGVDPSPYLVATVVTSAADQPIHACDLPGRLTGGLATEIKISLLCTVPSRHRQDVTERSRLERNFLHTYTNKEILFVKGPLSVLLDFGLVSLKHPGFLRVGTGCFTHMLISRKLYR